MSSLPTRRRRLKAWLAGKAEAAGIAPTTLAMAERWAAMGHADDAARLLRLGVCRSRQEAMRRYRPEPKATKIEVDGDGFNV